MNNTEKGAGIGGALGAGAGLAVGAATGNPRTGAAVGGLLGAGTGALIGNDVDQAERREREVQQAAAIASSQAQNRRMGMFDVIELSRNGHDEQVIINQIRATGSSFQLSTTDLDALKSNGVSSRVIAEMQAARSESPRVITPASNTIIMEPYISPPLVVRPWYVAPRPIFVGGYYHRHCH
jgi:hypothetical protein